MKKLKKKTCIDIAMFFVNLIIYCGFFILSVDEIYKATEEMVMRELLMDNPIKVGNYTVILVIGFYALAFFVANGVAKIFMKKNVEEKGF